MKRLLLAVLLVPLIPLCARAQEGPERLLSAETQVYVRWDGLDAHRAAFAKTALHKVLQGDLGDMLSGLLGDKKEHVLAKLASEVGKHGLVLGAEVHGKENAQVIIVLPNAKAQWEPLFGTVTWAADQNFTKIDEKEIAGRTVYQLQEKGPAHVAFWKEGKEAVFVVGTETPANLIKRWDGKGTRLADNPLYKKLTATKDFAPIVRGFVDVAALVKLTRELEPKSAKIIDELGLDGFKDLSFHYGFDGAALRGLVAVELPGPRKGLARFASAKPFTLDDLPAMPADMHGFSAVRFDALAVFDSAIEMLEKILPQEQAAQVKMGIAQANLLLGINIRDDLLGSLGALVVTYASPAEGMMFLGQTLVFQVKDAKKLQTTLDRLVKSIGELARVKLDLKQKDYHGVKLSQVYVHEKGMIVVPSYAITKDWLVIGLYPQPVQGFLLRSAGELPVWKPTAAVKASLDKLPGKYTLLSVDDPRPGVQFVLSLAPLVAAAILSANKDADFDVSVLPHAHLVLGHLFPNVTVANDDGKTWRLHSLSSIPLPIGLSQADSSMVLLMGAITTLGTSSQKTFQKIEKIEAPKKQ